MHEPGASGEALRFLARLEHWAAVDPSADAAALQGGLLVWLRRQQAAHPANGLLHQLAARALDAVDRSRLLGMIEPVLAEKA